VVRQRSSKPLFTGSNPVRASNFDSRPEDELWKQVVIPSVKLGMDFFLLASCESMVDIGGLSS
jgi:hypothetical protein